MLIYLKLFPLHEAAFPGQLESLMVCGLKYGDLIARQKYESAGKSSLIKSASLY